MTLPFWLDRLNAQDFYALFVVVSFAIALFFGLKLLKRLERRRMRTISNMEVTEAVITDSPEEDLESITRRRAAKSVRNRFTYIRRTFVPVALVVMCFLLAIIYLPAMSARYITIFAGLLVVFFGMIAKPIVENFIAGLVLTFSQPFRTGDTVVLEGHYGTVEKINMLHTVIKIWNWRRYIIPNSEVIRKEFQNLSKSDEFEWAYVSFWVCPSADLDEVKQLAKECMLQSSYLENHEKPSFWVTCLDKDAIQCWIAGWAATPANAWALKAETKRRLATELQKKGILTHQQQQKISLSSSPSKESLFQEANLT